MKKTKADRRALFRKMMEEEGLTRKPHSQETKDKISASQKGKKLGKIHKLRIAYARQCMKFTPEHREKISKALRNRKIGAKQIEGIFYTIGIDLPSKVERDKKLEQESIQKLGSDPFK